MKLVAECPNVIAIQHTEQGSTSGSSVFVAGTESFYPGLNLWDLGSFVSEVLEP
ncbi:MAG: hypothetical protein PGN25_03115 [Methylorubrum populi]